MVSTQGTYSDAQLFRNVISGDSESVGISGAVIANQYLRLWGPSPFDCAIGGIQAYARTAGSGAGSTIIDILKNGTSIWVNSADKPTLASASTGQFTLVAPSVRTIAKGDIIDIQVIQVPATAGHQKVSVMVTLEPPRGALTG